MWAASAFLTVIGLFCVAAGAVLNSMYRKKEAEVGHASARVVELTLRRGRDDETPDGIANAYYPVIEYYAEDRLYKTIYPHGSYPSKYSVGQEIKISFPHGNPEHYKIEEKDKLKPISELLSGCGVAFFILAVILFLKYAQA